MRNTFADTFYELSKQRDDLAVVVADISPAGAMGKFSEDFPDRFINTGVAEQVMIGLCAGMALSGLRPFAYTIATFALFRTFEFVRDDLCYQGLPVTVVGIGGGVTYSTLGGTHHAMEDVAVASAIPGMQVIAPCDPVETREITTYLATQNERPTYLRLGKAGEPDLTSNAIDPFRFGKLRYMRRGSDTCILSYGPTVATAITVAERLEARGESVSVCSVHSIKPLDTDGIAQALRDHGRVVIIEEMVPHGGLGSRVKEIAVDWDTGRRVTAFSLRDDFVHVYGNHSELLRAHGLDPDSIIERL